MKKLLSLVLSVFMVFGMVVSISATNTFETGKGNKTATPLNDEDVTTVTLSLPSDEAIKSSHVVLVLDSSTSTNEEIINATTELISTVSENISLDGSCKMTLITFNHAATNLGTFDVATQGEDIISAIKGIESKGGTNIHSGLLEATKVLDADSETDDSRKYVCVVSDGITYSFGEERSQMAWHYVIDGSDKDWYSPECLGLKYNKTEVYSVDNFETFLANVATQYENSKDYEYLKSAGYPATYPAAADYQQYANSVEVALLKSYQEFASLAEKYNAYSVTLQTGKKFTWGYQFMDYLATVGDGASISELKDDIVYYLGAGSTLTDVIGSELTLTDLMSFTVKVGEEQLESKVDYDNNTVQFLDGQGQVLFEIVYTDGEEEQFTVNINTNITIQNPVTISYDLKLDESVYDKDPGDYTTPTNESAILNPVDSDGNEQEVEEFPVPTVEYTVEEPQPTPAEDPEDPEEPEVEPEKKPTTPTKTPTNVEEPEVEEEVETGDNSNVYTYELLALLAAAGIGSIVLRKRLNK